MLLLLLPYDFVRVLIAISLMRYTIRNRSVRRAPSVCIHLNRLPDSMALVVL